MSQREEFENWMAIYWCGIKRTFLESADEYLDTSVQTAWEVWQKSANDVEQLKLKIQDLERKNEKLWRAIKLSLEI